MIDERNLPMPYLKSIIVYPIKSFDGVAVQSCGITPLGALENDRRFMLVDSNGARLNGKKHEKISRVRCSFDLKKMSVVFSFPGERPTEPLSLLEKREAVERLLSNYFEFAITVIENVEQGFPDDESANGPTIVSEASLREVQKWFPELSVEQISKRFRVNLIVGDTEPFWEDRLYGVVDKPGYFQIGSIHFSGLNPCQRCAVPTRDSVTGERMENFQKIFMQQREQTLPAWADKNRFNHFYRFTTNTRIVHMVQPALLTCGDIVTL